MKENSKPNLALHMIAFCFVFVMGYTVAIVPFDFLSQSISAVSDNDQEEIVELSAALKKVRAEYIKISDKADRTLIYKLFAGSAEYLSHAVSLQTTAQFDPMLGRVQSSYGWERDKHKEFTDAVSDYLIEAGYDEPRKLSTEEDREWFRDIFRALTDAIKG